MKEYDHLAIEKKWQKEWDKKKAYKTHNNSKKKKHYVLDMFPYPSGVGLHVGHPKGYIGSDVYARMKRMQGFNVLHPMGYDAFGLPAEQYALEHQIHPRKAVLENVKTFEEQLSKIGLGYDWDRRVNTTDPEFYRWTQWIFLKIFNSWYNKKTNKAEPIEDLIKIFEKSGNSGVDAATNYNIEFTVADWKFKKDKDKQDILMSYRLAYEGYSEVNWSPVLGTVLANDEVVDGPNGPVSERGGYPVIKKEMRQWFLRITAYGERLADGLETLDWSQHIKEIQKNWIGKSEGAQIKFSIRNSQFSKEKIGNVEIFTTRPDTIFGATYLVLAPEHSILEEIKSKIENWEKVLQYIVVNRNKTLDERTDGTKEKTGVKLEGISAINPANGEEIPVFVADYVLVNYGTGAIMAVPAHDERDFEFAKKYALPFKRVIAPYLIDSHDPPILGKKTLNKKVVQCFIENPIKDKVLVLKWEKFSWVSFISGGIDNNDNPQDTAIREIKEETGYIDIKSIKPIGDVFYTTYHASHKDENREAEVFVFHVVLNSLKQVDTSKSENEKFKAIWVSKEEAKRIVNQVEASEIWKMLDGSENIYSGNGILTNSGKFNSLTSEEAKIKITEEVGGKIITKYKMRDAVFARQRYWGEPIPLMHDKNGIIKPFPLKSLPLKLPEVKSYMPTGTGESPLAGVKEWIKKGLETNTMPGWAGSSWYFLRYMDPRNKKAFADKNAIQYWKNVDVYVGGAEHATGHLLYSRFWHMFLRDYNLVVTDEPFQKLYNQGMILGTDNRKMSKRWGNVVNPNEIVKYYGADTLRVYEMFMGPFEASLPWSTDNIIGSRRFLDRVWRITQKVESKTKSEQKFEALLHRTVKKVGEDIESFSFNTAVSSMMILLNEMEKLETVNQKNFEMFLKILNPFAPHITEEIWRYLGNKNLLVLEKWPKADPKKMLELEVKLIVQINGRVRAQCMIILNSPEPEVLELVKNLPDVEKWILGKEIKKVIYVPNKIINFVVI